MLKKIKNISIFVVVTCYVLQSCMLFSGTLIERIQEIRTQIQISKIHLVENKLISLSEWKSIQNKKEIKLNNIYYDVISFKISSKQVAINAVKDKHENNFRMILNNLSNKKEIPNSSKKKTYKVCSFITTLTNNDYQIETIFNLFLIKQNFNTSNKDVNKIALAIYKPPC